MEPRATETPALDCFYPSSSLQLEMKPGSDIPKAISQMWHWYTITGRHNHDEVSVVANGIKITMSKQ